MARRNNDIFAPQRERKAIGWLIAVVLLLAALIYPLCNLIYIIIQDKYIFPLYIEGYESYKRSVPFLIPRYRGK